MKSAQISNNALNSWIGESRKNKNYELVSALSELKERREKELIPKEQLLKQYHDRFVAENAAEKIEIIAYVGEKQLGCSQAIYLHEFMSVGEKSKTFFADKILEEMKIMLQPYFRNEIGTLVNKYKPTEYNISVFGGNKNGPIL